MATINPFLPSPALIRRRPIWQTTGGSLVTALAALRHGWRAFVRYKRLAVLSAAALRARGLKREEIGRRAFFDSQD
jgi:hypothetical protein